jgi:hypothetical protein
MIRITDKDLQAVVDMLNRITGNPAVPYLSPVDGKAQPQGGCYHLSHAYGGVALHQMCATGTGIHDTFSRGHMPKRELYELMHAFQRGYNLRGAA